VRLMSSSFGPNERWSSPSGSLRSDAWLGGDDEVALNHRAALRAAGLRRSDGSRRPASRRPGRPSRRPLIGIACTASDLNRCDRGLTALAAAVRRGIEAAGGLPLEFPVMSLSEDLMKPTAMLYRNLLATEVEETDLRGWPVLHRMHVTQAPEGCDYDFLQAKTAEQIAFVEPVIGRS
jgi:dihydroxyacid dehydratase/phosphogluconate dehydratase